MSMSAIIGGNLRVLKEEVLGFVDWHFEPILIGVCQPSVVLFSSFISFADREPWKSSTLRCRCCGQKSTKIHANAVHNHKRRIFTDLFGSKRSKSLPKIHISSIFGRCRTLVPFDKAQLQDHQVCNRARREGDTTRGSAASWMSGRWGWRACMWWWQKKMGAKVD